MCVNGGWSPPVLGQPIKCTSEPIRKCRWDRVEGGESGVYVLLVDHVRRNRGRGASWLAQLPGGVRGVPRKREAVHAEDGRGSGGNVVRKRVVASTKHALLGNRMGHLSELGLEESFSGCDRELGGNNTCRCAKRHQCTTTNPASAHVSWPVAWLRLVTRRIGGKKKKKKKKFVLKFI